MGAKSDNRPAQVMGATKDLKIVAGAAAAHGKRPNVVDLQMTSFLATSAIWVPVLAAVASALEGQALFPDGYIAGCPFGIAHWDGTVFSGPCLLALPLGAHDLRLSTQLQRAQFFIHKRLEDLNFIQIRHVLFEPFDFPQHAFSERDALLFFYGP